MENLEDQLIETREEMVELTVIRVRVRVRGEEMMELTVICDEYAILTLSLLPRQFA